MSFLGNHDKAADDLADYLDRFAGRYFERVDGGGDRPDVCNVFTAADITAIGTLSVNLTGPAIAELLFGVSAESATKWLGRIRPGATIYDADAHDLIAGPAQELWDVVIGLPKVGRTKASKLLARKRPHLFPIIDSVVATKLGSPENFWQPMLAEFKTAEVRRQIAELRVDAKVPAEISDLRIADIVVWMA